MAQLRRGLLALWLGPEDGAELDRRIVAEGLGDTILSGYDLRLYEYPDDSVVVCVTGQGLKTTDPLAPLLPVPPVIPARLAEFDALVSREDRS